jgi:hypothetical protein
MVSMAVVRPLGRLYGLRVFPARGSLAVLSRIAALAPGRVARAFGARPATASLRRTPTRLPGSRSKYLTSVATSVWQVMAEPFVHARIPRTSAPTCIDQTRHSAHQAMKHAAHEAIVSRLPAPRPSSTYRA